MIISYKYKLNPSLTQEELMTNWLNMLRANYNYCLRDRIENYEQVKTPKLGNYCDLKTKAECCPLTCSISKDTDLGYPFKKNGQKRSAFERQSSELPILKKNRPWYKTIASDVLQQNLRRLNTAFQNFFEGRGYPKFKLKHKFKSFKYPPGRIKIDGNKILLPSIGWMRFFKSREIPFGFDIRSVTVRKKADGWYVSICLEDRTVPQSQPIDLDRVKTVVGIDLGIKKLLSISNGETIANPQFEKKLERRKTIRQRKISRKKRGSNNKKKGYQKLARINQKIVNQREDSQWKIGHKLIRLADVLVFEDLNIQGMIKRCRTKQDENGKYLKNGQSAKRALNRLIRDCSWGNLKQKIYLVAEKFGCICVDVNPKFTSQQCSNCGHIAKENREKERFLCLNCGYLEDADVQASINIGKKGIEILGLNQNKLLRVPQKVTATFESTKVISNNQDTSISLEVEPSNPVQLTLFNWDSNSQAIEGQNPHPQRR